MAVSLATLKGRLEGAVPARNSIPSSSQYEQAVRDAVADYSQRVPLQKLATLNIVSGTATYTLPADFLKVIRLETLASADGVLFTADGLVPTGSSWRERYYIVGNQITFDPTPQYTMARDLWYAAAYVLDAEEIYQDLTGAAAAIIMLKAQALALGLQANKAAQEAWQYAIGDERVNKEKLSAALEAQAKAMEARYTAAIASTVVGPAGTRADYPLSAYS
jgi:hypothetical protein